MKQCINCGAILPEGEQSVCFVCGTRQAESAAPAPSAAAQPGGQPPRAAFGAPSAPPANAPLGNRPAPRADAPHASRPQSRAPEPPRSRAQTAPDAKGAPHGKSRPNDSALLYGGAPAATATAAAARRKPDKLLRILALVLAGMVALLVLGVGVTYLLSGRYNATVAYSALSTALQKGDIAALRTLVAGDGVTVTDSGLTALCRAFTTQENVDRLLEQLQRQSADAAGQATGAEAELPYPALSPITDTVFLGYKEYKLLAKPVALQISTGASNTLLNLDGSAVTGEPTEGGALYNNLFPGIYTCTVSGQTALGETMGGAPTDLALFDPAAPVVFDGALPIADITVAGCLSDEAVIAVNGKDVAQKPVEKTVSLPQVAVGSTITMRYTTPYGATTTASVQFADRAQAALAFTGHATEGGVPAEADLKALFGGFYASYLDAMNNSDVARITGCTEAMRSKLSGDIGTDEAKATLYVFKEAAVSMTAVEQSFLEDATPTLKLNAQCTYTTAKRAGEKSKKDDDQKETSHTFYYAVELVYADGGWKVNRLAQSAQENYDAGTLVPIEG